MGSDNLEQFSRWRRWQRLARRVPIAVVQRPGTILAALQCAPGAAFRHAARCAPLRLTPPAVTILDGARIVSASAIRGCARWAEALGAAILSPC